MEPVKFNSSIKNVCVKPISFGLGDIVFSLPIIQALIEKKYNTWAVYKNEIQKDLLFSLPGLSGSISELGLACLPSNTQLIDLRDHYLQKNYWWGGSSFKADYPDFYINDISKVIASDFGLPFDFENLRPLSFQQINGLNNTIIFIPGSDGPYKCWLDNYWLELAENLNKINYNVVVIGQIDSSQAVRNLIAGGLKHEPTPSIQDAINIISSCLAVVSIDTGLGHLAVQQGINTVLLLRPDSVFYRPYKHSAKLNGYACSEICINNYDDRIETSLNQNLDTYVGLECKANYRQECMSKITPEMVISEMKKLFAQNYAKI